MKKIAKFFVAFVMLFGIGLLFVNNLPKAKAAGNPLTTLSVGGYVFSNVDSDLHSSYYDSTDVSWQYLSASKKLVLYDYHGPQITMVLLEGDFCPAIDVFGECVINVEGDTNPGILFEGSALVQPLITFNGENASLTINGGNCGIKSITDGEKKIYFEAAEQSKLNIYSNGIGVDAGIFFLTDKVDAYINSKGYGIFAPYSGAYTISGVSNSSCSLTIISKERTALPVDSLYADKQIHLSNNFDEAKEYVSSDNKVYHVASEEKYMEGFLQFTDLSGKLRAINSKYININVGDTETFGFNNMEIPTSMEDYKIVRTLDYRKNGSETPIYTITNESNTNLNYDVSPADIDLYILRYTLKLLKGDNVIKEINERNRVYPITTHTISTNIHGLKIIPLSHPNCEVKTGESFQFYVQIESNYYNSGSILYADGEELGYIHSSAYTINNIRKDIEIYSNESLGYKTNYKVYSGDFLIASGFVNKGISYVLPTLNPGQIPSGMTFDYWKVGDRPNHYANGTEITFKEEERGELRIEAHFAGLYNLTIQDGAFYSDSECTQSITQAAKVAVGSGKYTYFKFNQEVDTVVDGKLLYSYEAVYDGSGLSIWEGDGYWFFELTIDSDITIYPIYKDVIDEVTVLNVIHPIGNFPYIEEQECAPSDANYKVPTSSLWWYELDSDNNRAKFIRTYDPNNPYIFKNDTKYEVCINFRFNEGFIFDPAGYNRDGLYQFHIDGLESEEYEVISCDFTNVSKEQYEVVIRFNSINSYALNITNGSAYVELDAIEYAVSGEKIMLSANVAPIGKAFDKWEITGITIDETSLSGSKLAITMPGNDVTATATYKDVEYFEVTFNNNGGTGIIDDDISYGEYILPACTFEAPEHKHFKCWSVNETEYDELVEITVNSNIEVKAIWELDTFTINFNNNGGTGTMDEETKAYGSTFDLPACTFTAPDHKHFVGWSLEAAGEVITTSTIDITDNVVLYAIYELDTFTINFNNNGGTGSMDEETKAYGSTFALPTCTFTAPDHKHFVGWSLEATGEVITTSTIDITDNVVLYAIYEEIHEDVTLTKIELSGTYKTKYNVGDTFSSEGIIVTATYSDDSTQNINLSLVTISGYNLSNEGTQTVTVTYEGKTATFTITVEKKSDPTPIDPDPVNPDPVNPDDPVDPTPTPGKKKNNAGLVVGIVLGSIALCAGIAVGAVLIIKKKH